ncbi:MAG: segregation/condensation protein A [Chitinispirillaceae bacterium]|nr:segregation/condensation protein A [Chitinispirillaceae bacterium]
MPLRSSEYQVRLEFFEGPLDLLLYLVNKAEVNIVDICVAEITEQYLQYIDLMRELNINVASEYLHMAATLIRLKARELLPDQGGEESGAEEEGIYNREQLIAQLLEYKKFKEAALTLRTFESEHFGAYPRGVAEQIEVSKERDDIDLGNISIFDLLSAFKRVLDRAKKEEDLLEVVADTLTIDEKIDKILSILSENQSEILFEELFNDDKRKISIVVTFMAILELVKMGEITFRQEELFGPIYVCRILADVKREDEEK